ncbi:MAG: hypothetical protein ACI9LU_002556, partial [Polaribacter sp.]
PSTSFSYRIHCNSYLALTMNPTIAGKYDTFKEVLKA